MKSKEDQDQEMTFQTVKYFKMQSEDGRWRGVWKLALVGSWPDIVGLSYEPRQMRTASRRLAQLSQAEILYFIGRLFIKERYKFMSLISVS